MRLVLEFISLTTKESNLRTLCCDDNRLNLKYFIDVIKGVEIGPSSGFVPVSTLTKDFNRVGVHLNTLS